MKISIRFLIVTLNMSRMCWSTFKLSGHVLFFLTSALFLYNTDTQIKITYLRKSVIAKDKFIPIRDNHDEVEN